MIRAGEYKLNPAHVVAVTSHEIVRVSMAAPVHSDGRTQAVITADNPDGARAMVQMVEAVVDAFNSH